MGNDLVDALWPLASTYLLMFSLYVDLRWINHGIIALLCSADAQVFFLFLFAHINLSDDTFH